MANELGPFPYPSSGLSTLYAQVFAAGALIVNATTGATMSLSSANWANGVHTLSDTGHVQLYYGSANAGMANARYYVGVFRMIGSSAAITDECVGAPVALDWGPSVGDITGRNTTHIAYQPASFDSTLGTNISSIVAQFAGGNVFLVRAYVNGDVEIRKGDSYGAAVGQTLQVTKPSGAQWPTDLTSWTIEFTATKAANNDATGTATIGPITCRHGTETGSSQSFYIDLTAAQTGVALGAWTYDVQARLSGDRNTLVSGNLRVLPEYTTG